MRLTLFLRLSLAVAPLIGAAAPVLGAPQPMIDPLSESGEVHDLACLQGLAYARDSMLEAKRNGSDSGDPDSLMPPISFYAGKVALKHPLRPVWDVVKEKQAQILAMMNEMNANTCSGEYQIAMGLEKP